MTTQQLTRSHRPWLIFTSMSAIVFLGGSAGSDAGIQGSGRNLAIVAYGPITAFGSIVVDDVEYTIDNASISVNGQPATTSQLEVGQIVTVQGVQNAGGTTGTAASVSFNADVMGPIGRLDIAGRTMTVLGQTVQLESDTVFGAGIQGDSLAGLQAGIAVEVSAFEDASGNLHASRIDLLPGDAPLQVKGTVQALDAAAQTFKVNELTVDYSGVQVGSQLANGGMVIVGANAAPAGDVLYASKVQVSSGLGGTANQQGQMRGLITSMTSGQAFTVEGQQVQTDAGTQFVLHGRTLAPNVAISVHGTFTASGVLLADKVEATASARQRQ